MSTETEERPRVYLDSVHLKGFKSIEDLSIDFKKGLNILIGKNGSGKSNFLEFVDLSIRRPNTSRSVFPKTFDYAYLKFISDDNHSFALFIEKTLSQVEVDDYGLDHRFTLLEKFEIDKTTVIDNFSIGQTKDSFYFKNKEILYRTSIRSLFRTMGYEQFYPKFIKFNLPKTHWDCISIPGTLTVELRNEFTIWGYPDCLGFLTNIFEEIELSYDDSVKKTQANLEHSIYKQLKIDDKILENLKRYTTIEDLRFNKNINIYSTEKNITIENLKLEFKINDTWHPWSQLSDGTKRIFFVIAEAVNAKGLILIEEPELGIHPHQFNLLMDFLKEQSEDKQIIISTHSPKALDHLSPDELDHILIAYYDLEKATQIRHLSDKEVKKARKYMKEVGFFSDYWILSDLE